MKLILLLPLLILPFSNSNADHPRSFSQAKNMANKLYQTHLKTFYCGCDLTAVGKKKKLTPEMNRCGYQPRVSITRKGNPNVRTKRIEWEHIVPAWAFGHQRQCWQKGGRRNCAKSDKLFKKMEADLHNLAPAIGELNGDRSNFRFAMIPGEPRAYGACDFEVDFKSRKAEPPKNVQGDIARVYFYMRDQYQLKLSKSQEQLFNAWSKLDPVDLWECRRDVLVTGVQGNSNPYVAEACQYVASH